jgi:hypothetical protein
MTLITRPQRIKSQAGWALISSGLRLAKGEDFGKNVRDTGKF